MDLGIVSSAHLPTAYGEFNIHVLPEKLRLGSVKGRTVAAFVEHYVLAPTQFNPHKPATIYVHRLDIFDDLFRLGSGHTPSLPRKILKKLSRGENGLLLYAGTLDHATFARLRARADKPAAAARTTEKQIVDHIVEYLGIEHPKTVFTRDRRKPSAPAAPMVRIDTDLGAFDVHRMDEVVHVNFPEAALWSLFPRDACAPAGKRPVLLKSLTHFALVAGRGKGRDRAGDLPFVRVHSSCATGDINRSYRCDCGIQFCKALAIIARHGGAVIYHDAEGRGIHSLAIKMQFYKLHRQGFDTYTSMTSFGYAEDCRNYAPVAALLRRLKMKKIVLLTNNPRKIEDVRRAGIAVAKTARVRLEHVPDATKFYLETKKKKGGHKLK